jgi:hypothetical protein
MSNKDIKGKNAEVLSIKNSNDEVLTTKTSDDEVLGTKTGNDDDETNSTKTGNDEVLGTKTTSDNVNKRTIDCGICLDIMRLPYSFSCGHSICIVCTAESLNRELSCPFCRKKIRFAMPNYTLMDVLDQGDSQTTDEEKSLQTIITSFFDDDNHRINMSSMSSSLPSIGQRVSTEQLLANTTFDPIPYNRYITNSQPIVTNGGIPPPLIPLPQFTPVTLPSLDAESHEVNTIGDWKRKNRNKEWMCGYVLLTVVNEVIDGELPERIIKKCKGASLSACESACYYYLKTRLPENFTDKMVFDWIWHYITDGNVDKIYTDNILSEMDFNFLKFLVRRHPDAKRSSRNVLITYLKDKEVDKEDLYPNDI